MTLTELADVAEVVGALGVIAGLVFVGIQLRQNTKQMQRGEANSAMTQGSAMRQLLLSNRDTAELVFSGLTDAPLPPLDELRLNAFFSEIAYMAMHVWDRARNDLAPKDELVRVLPTFEWTLTSTRGRAWWEKMRSTLRPDFVTDFEALLPALKPQPPQEHAPSATAPQGAESAVARTSDAV